MREMHKWKDKVEFSLDNRQIFFLFFGLSVVGCFVFALGIMTGRRLQWDPGEQVAAVGDQNSLDMLEGEEEDERFAFKRGLSESDTEAIPPTRDPGVPPRDEDEVKAEKKAAAEALAAAKAAAKAEQVEQREAQLAAVDAQVDAHERVLAQGEPAAAQPQGETAEADGKRQFTLQMKAFSRIEDAEKLADKLRHNGHDVRIESHEARGRTWHRVRLGVYEDWATALEAKTAFEESEKIIAYVVSV